MQAGKRSVVIHMFFLQTVKFLKSCNLISNHKNLFQRYKIVATLF